MNDAAEISCSTAGIGYALVGGVGVVTSSRRWLWWAAGFAGLLLAGLQFINLIRSTAQIENRSRRPIERVAVVVAGVPQELGNLPPGKSRFILLPRRGDSTFRLRYTAGGGQFTQCSEYVQDVMFHIRALIEPNLMAECNSELRVVSREFVFWEMLRPQ